MGVYPTLKAHSALSSPQGRHHVSKHLIKNTEDKSSIYLKLPAIIVSCFTPPSIFRYVSQFVFQHHLVAPCQSVEFLSTAVLQHPALLISSSFTVPQATSSSRDSVITWPMTLKVTSPQATCHAASVSQHFLTTLTRWICNRCKQIVCNNNTRSAVKALLFYMKSP